MAADGQRQLPFIKRNFARAINAFNGAFGSPVLSSRDSDVLLHANGERPRKRRRLSTPIRDGDKLVDTTNLSVSRQELRFEILRCHHKDAVGARHSSGAVVSPDATTKAKCRITISDASFSRPKVLHCDSQACVIVTFRTPADPHRIARIELPHPFYVPRDKLMFNRPDDATYDLGDSYKVSVEIEPADAANWPPLDLQDLGGVSQSSLASAATQNWTFSSPFDKLFGRLKAPLSLVTRSHLAESTHETDYELDVELQWSSGIVSSASLEQEAKDAALWADVDSKDMALNTTPRKNRNGINVDRTPSRGSRAHHDDNLNGGDHTPSRGLRTRGGDKNYNLKALSDKAAGRKRKQDKSGVSLVFGEGRVKYFLPPGDPVSLDGFRCVNCGCFHTSLYNLQTHLQVAHADYDFKLEDADEGPRFHVFNRADSPDLNKSFSTHYPRRGFNLETFVTSDRIRPATSHGAESPRRADSSVAAGGLDRNTPTSPSRGLAATKTSPRRRSVTIPKTPHIFYHPVSKQELKVGDKVPDPVLEKQWFHHKHHHNLDDVVDVTAAELEYVKAFDDFMREHDISARTYFPRMWLRFVEANATWLLEAKHRMQEFGMHECYLAASNLIDREHIQEAAGHFERERARRDTSATSEVAHAQKKDGTPTRTRASRRLSPEPPEKMPSVRKSANGCSTCGLPVISGPRTLICSNTV